jgi:hypothetical protein
MFYSKSLSHIYKCEKIHCFIEHIISSLKSICLYKHACLMSVWLSVRYIGRWVSIHSLCMHNQTGDSQTSIPLFSWDLLCLFFIFHILSWLIEETCNLSKLTFFLVLSIYLFCVYKWNRSSCVYDSIQNWASYIVYIGTVWHIHFFFSIICI